VEWLVQTEEGVLVEVVNSSSAMVAVNREATAVTSTLTLLAVQLAAAGVYVCTANNSLGNDTARASITVYGKVLAVEGGDTTTHEVVFLL